MPIRIQRAYTDSQSRSGIQPQRDRDPGREGFIRPAGSGDLDHATNERLYVSLRPSGHGANGRAMTTGEVEMISKELNTDIRDLTDDELEAVAAGFWAELLGAAVGAGVSWLLNWIHHK
jgi:hypothetical protein